jgi:hypothetical protein
LPSLTEQSDHRHRRLLRPRRERPNRRCANEQCDELAAPHVGHVDFLFSVFRTLNLPQWGR